MQIPCSRNDKSSGQTETPCRGCRIRHRSTRSDRVHCLSADTPRPQPYETLAERSAIAFSCRRRTAFRPIYGWLNRGENNTVIRRRLAQKMEFLIQDTARRFALKLVSTVTGLNNRPSAALFDGQNDGQIRLTHQHLMVTSRDRSTPILALGIKTVRQAELGRVRL